MHEHSPTDPPDHRTVLQRLIDVRRQVGAVAKTERNSQGNYNFRGIDAVVNATAAALVEHGVTVAPYRVVRVEHGQITYGSKDARSQFTRVVIRYRVYGLNGDRITVEAAGEAFDSGDKATPKASTVAWRTALLQLLHLPTDEPDPDSYTYSPEPDELDVAKTEAWNATGFALGFTPADHDARVALLRSAIEKVGASMESTSADQWFAAAESIKGGHR